MTPTQRLQADWPKWEINVSQVNGLGWTWSARVLWNNSALIISAAHNGDRWYQSNASTACRCCDRALKAIRKAVTK